MAETYKGLTIKFGGETTELKKALTNITATARLAESEMRRVNQALRLDPSNIQATAMKFDLLESKSQQASAKINLLEQSLKDLSNRRQDLANMSISDLVEEATKGRTEYNQLNEEIRKTKNEIEAVTNEKFPTDNVEEYLAALDKTDPKLRSLVEQYERLRNTRASMDTDLLFKDAERMANLKTEIAKTNAEMEKYTREMKQMVAESAGIDRVGANFLEIKNKTQQASESADRLEKELDQLNNALKLDPSSVEAAAAKIENLRQQSDAASDKVHLLETRLDQIKGAVGAEKVSAAMKDISANAEKAGQNFEEATAAVRKMQGEVIKLRDEQRLIKTKQGEFSEAYRDVTVQVEKAEGKLRTLVAEQEKAKHEFQDAKLAQEYRELNTELTETKAKLNSVNAELNESAGKFSMSTSSLTTLGLALYSTVTPAVGMASSKIIESAETIDGAFRDMKKTVEGTEEQFQELKSAAIEYSSTHITSADQILEIEAMGGQLGIVVEQLQTFSEVVSNLDIATNMETETIAENLGSLSNIMHMSEDDFTRFGDSLVRLGNNMPTQESKIMDITTRIGSLGSIVGMTAPQILAWSTAIAATGQKTESAGTAMSTTISDIETAVAKGGKSLEGFAKVAGKSAEEFAKTWKDNPSQALKEFVEGLRKVKDSGGSVDKTLEDLGITGARQKQALLGLTQTVNVLDDALTMSQNAWDGVSDQWGKAGDAAREAAQKSEGFSGALGILRNIVSNFASEAGESLTEPMKAIGDALYVVAKGFEELPEGMQTFLTLAIASTAAFGPLLTLFAGANTAFGKINEALLKSARNWRVANTGVASFSDAIRSSIRPIQAQGKAIELTDKQMERYMLTSKAASAALTAMKVAVVALALVIVSKLVTAIGEYVEYQNNLKKGTEGLTDSLYSMSDGFTASSSEAANAIRSMESTTKSYEVIRQQIRDTAQAQAELAQTISETMTEVGQKIGIAESYKEKLLSLAGGAADTEEEVGQLKTSVDMVNEALGLNLTVVKEADGSYAVYRDGVKMTVGELEKLISTTELAMQVEAQRQALTNLNNQKADAEKSFNDALKAEEEAYKRLNEAMYGTDEQYKIAQKNYDYAKAQREEAERGLNSLNDAVTVVTQNLNFLNEAQEAGADSLKYAVASNSLFVTSMNEAKKSVPDFVKKLEELGITTEQFSQLSNEQLVTLANSYDGTLESIYNALQQMGLGWGDAAKVEQEALDRMKQDLVDYGLSEQTVAGMSKESIAKIRDGFSSLADKAGISVQELITKMKDFGITEEQIAGLTPEQVDKIVSAYENGDNDLNSILSHIKDNTVDKMEAGAAEAMDKLISEFKSAAPKAETEGKNIAGRGKKGFESVNATQSGRNFTQGFINGMGSLMGSVFLKGVSVAESALAGLRKGQQEGSPSKLTRKSGKFFVGGYVMEIEDGISSAVQAAKKLGKETAMALQSEADGIDATFAVSTEHGYGAARAGTVYNNPSETINVYIDGAIVNDNEQIGIVLKDTLLEYKRKSDM